MTMQFLNDVWWICPDPDDSGLTQGYATTRPDCVKEAVVPGIIQQVFPDYHGVAWYWNEFKTRQQLPSHHRYRLRFGSVDYLADVWLNGEYVGRHEGGETPFSFDVTEILIPDASNNLAVRVVNPTDKPIEGMTVQNTPGRNKFAEGYQPGRSYNAGGITQPVSLCLVPDKRIEDVFIQSDCASGTSAVEVTVDNDAGTTVSVSLRGEIADTNGDVQDYKELIVDIPAGQSVHVLELKVESPRLWELDSPCLYTVKVEIQGTNEDGSPLIHSKSKRTGFRDFCVKEGYFYLNGKRLFLKSTHTANHYPIGQVVPSKPDFVRRDLILAKAAGFNMVRFIAGMPLEEQLDFCDEIGLMVYEENYSAWALEDSPEMAARFDRSLKEMLLRDRNHPCITIWGLLNETFEGPVFKHAVNALQLLRSLDRTRLVLLGSGRWDCQPSIGSVSNPGSDEWEMQWGQEAPGAKGVPNTWDYNHGGYFDGMGDIHVYPVVPHPPHTLEFLRNLGKDSKPVFLSEYGTGSLMNVIRELRCFEQQNANPELPDMALINSIAERLQCDWDKFGMQEVYPTIEDMLIDSQRLHIRQRQLGFDLIRSNPKICGFNITGMLDHVITGEGLWSFWRELKPGVMDVLCEGHAPLRWCVFVQPSHVYAGRKFTVEAVLANEDVLSPGGYPVGLRIFGPEGTVWRKESVLEIPSANKVSQPPLAVPVACDTVEVCGPAGEYEFSAHMLKGGAPAGGRLKFHVSDPSSLPSLEGEAFTWGIGSEVEQWLSQQGLKCRHYDQSTGDTDLLLVGNVAEEQSSPEKWGRLFDSINRGAKVIFLHPETIKQVEEHFGWTESKDHPGCYRFADWLYHKECVAKRHPIFDGLSKGIMDWDYYGAVIPKFIIDLPMATDDVAAAAFAAGYPCETGYASGVLVGSYGHGKGRFLLSTMEILENIDKHPAADRLLINMVRYFS